MEYPINNFEKQYLLLLSKKTKTYQIMMSSTMNQSLKQISVLFLFLLTSWSASAQMNQDCSCELDYNPITTFQSPFDDCCYAFVFGEVTVVPPEGNSPGLNECLVSQSDNVQWHVSGPGINMGTSTGPNEAFVHCFTNGDYTICARRQVVVVNPNTGEEEECTISDCTTVSITECGDEECVCIPENLGINIGNINVNGCSVYVSGSSEPVDGCWTLKEIRYDWGDTQVVTIEDDWVSARHTYGCNGLYEVTITGVYVNDDGDICESSDSEWVSITNCGECLQGNVPTGSTIDGSSSTSALGISPNPVNDLLVLTHGFVTDQQASVRIINLAGQTLAEYQEKVMNPTMEFSVADLPDGMYYLVVMTEQGDRFTKAFVKS